MQDFFLNKSTDYFYKFADKTLKLSITRNVVKFCSCSRVFRCLSGFRLHEGIVSFNVKLLEINSTAYTVQHVYILSFKTNLRNEIF